MCGIAGILHYQPEVPEGEEPLERMRRALRHRGPDDEGVFLSGTEGAETRCGLAHTRLSILDLSPAGHQPMATPDGRFRIAFNGEIYNFRELRRELASEGVRFQSQSDTEVILRLYEREGPRCVERLSGMFAFAIWDAREETCFLARDPLAIKPLYYFVEGNRLVFASELRALLASGLVPRRICVEALQGFLLTGSVPGTLIEGVRLLPGGHTLFWRRGQAKVERYWRLSFRPRPEEAADAAALTRTALLDSLRRHLVSDVPVGLFLSGGLDSTALLALAQQLEGGELKTFCISLDDPRFNEGDVARRTAEHFGAQHFDWRLDAPAGAAMFEEFLSRLDQPTIDGFNTFCVSRYARDCGIKAVMSGLGGDELFGGYASFRAVPRLYRWSRALDPTAFGRAAAGRVIQASAPRAPWRRLGEYLCATPTMRGAYETYRGIYTHAEAARLARYYLGEAPSAPEPRPRAAPDPTLEDEVSRLEIENYLCFQLLRDSDVMSMASGLELRLPFVDRQLMDTLTSIPAARRLAAKKALLREAVPEMPEWVARRPKQGFRFPFEDWLAADWKPLFENVGQGSGVRVQTWYQKWSLFVLNRWCESLQVPLPGIQP